jgi:hypothetical protein
MLTTIFNFRLIENVGRQFSVSQIGLKKVESDRFLISIKKRFSQMERHAYLSCANADADGNAILSGFHSPGQMPGRSFIPCAAAMRVRPCCSDSPGGFPVFSKRLRAVSRAGPGQARGSDMGVPIAPKNWQLEIP